MALESTKAALSGLALSSPSEIHHADNEQHVPVGTMNCEEQDDVCGPSNKKASADIDVKEVYFLIMHFLSDGPCRKACAQLREELEEYKLLPRRYHAWYSREGTCSGNKEDDGVSVPLSYSELLQRFSSIEKTHLLNLLEELVSRKSEGGPSHDAKNPTAADASTLLGTDSVSLLKRSSVINKVHGFSRQKGQMYGLTIRELGGGVPHHHRAPSVRGASYHIVEPSVLVNRIQMIKTLRGHRNAVYCAIFDKSGDHIITGSDDRLVKIWSTTTGFCLCSCRGHEGDITDLAVSANNLLMASASNDFVIRVWRFPDGLPVAVLKGHTGAVTAIAFSPRHGCEHHLLSASDDGTCRVWDARDSTINARIYAPKLEIQENGSNIPDSVQTSSVTRTQILCCAFNASGTVFVTGSADKLARVWDACRWSDENHGAPNHEIDCLKGHEDVVNYVQFSGCAAPSRPVNLEMRQGHSFGLAKNDRISRFSNSWFGYESIVSCSHDGSAIIWVSRPRKYHGRNRWMKVHHLRVPPPSTPPLPPPRGVLRQRLPPTPRNVNMIIWSLDNRYVLAAIMDCSICVWNAVDGSLVHSLTGHTKSTYVLDVHPYDPRIAMSAGYDGHVIIWDIWEGRSIHSYQMGDFHLVDGKFSPDGTSIVISDEVGQIYLLATGEGRSQKDAKYDQFFLGDYRPLVRDVHGNVLDPETQLPPHQRNLQDLLCDSNMIPYAEPYQTMYQQRRLGAIGISWTPPPPQWAARSFEESSYLDNGFPLLLPPDEEDVALGTQGGTRWVEQPIDDDVMDWEQDSVDDAGSDYTLSFDNPGDEEEIEGGLTSSEELLDSLEEEDSCEDQRASLRRSERNKKKEEEIGTSSRRSKKRKHSNGSRDYSLRSSKRHRKNKISLKSSKRAIEGELPQRRPKRLAARNARLIFSRISAEEDEERSDAYSSEKVESDGEEPFSSRESLNSEEEGKLMENLEDSWMEEAGPSKVSQIRATRSNRSEKLRIPLRRPIYDTQESVVHLEQEIHPSPSKGKRLDDESGWQNDVAEIVNGRQNSSTQVSIGEQRLSDIQRMEVEEISSIYARGKEKTVNDLAQCDVNQTEGDKIINVQDSLDQPNVACLLPPSGSRELYYDPDQEGEGTDHDRVKMYMQQNNHIYARFKEQKSNSVGRGADGPEPVHNNNVMKETKSSSRNISNDERTAGCATSNQSFEPNHFWEGQEGGEQDLSSCDLLMDTNSVKSVEEDNISSRYYLSNKTGVEQSENGSSSHKSIAEINEEHLKNHAQTTLIEGDMMNGDNDAKKNVYLKSVATSHGRPNVTASSYNHQSMGTSWKNNSPTCLWLRQCHSDTRVENSSSEDKSSDDDTNEGHENHVEEIQDCHLNLTFKRGKRKMMKPRQKLVMVAAPVSQVEVREEPSVSEYSNGVDNELSCALPVTLTYVRTRRNLVVDEEKRSDESNHNESRVEKREGLRCSMRPRSSVVHAEHGRSTDDISWKGNRHNMSKVSWLMLTKVEEGARYIPQLGDEVAYVVQGQDEFPDLARLEDKGTPKNLRSRLRPVELCQVVAIDYAIIPGFSSVTCKLTLRLISADCRAYGKTFKLTFPELTDFPDFIIEKSRYEAGVKRNWTKRDKCKVWWRTNTVDENGETKTGEWYPGRVVSVEAKSPQFPGSPWEECIVQYKGDSTGPHRHSPWELFDIDSVEPSFSCIDEEVKSRILSILEELEESSQDDYGFHALSKLVHKVDFLSKTLVPVSFETIRDRIHNNYYRSFDALQHDVQLLLTNVENYLSKDNELTMKIIRLADLILEER